MNPANTPPANAVITCPVENKISGNKSPPSASYGIYCKKHNIYCNTNTARNRLR